MKAFLLAAGYGTRLKPLTDRIPKCLIPIHGKPLMQWWFELFEKHGITEVLVNTHYLAEQVEAFVAQYSVQHPRMKIVIAHEATLLGSGGTIRENQNFIGDDSDFLICYADNLTDINLSEMMQYHREHTGALTMALFHAPQPEQCGIATLDQNGTIVRFVEKPQMPESDLANAGIYISNRKILKLLKEQKLLDLGFDVLPKLVGDMNGYSIDCFLMDTGTPERYQKAREAWSYDHF